jgi:hypothetical protein
MQDRRLGHAGFGARLALALDQSREKGRHAMSKMIDRKDAFMSSMERTPAQLYWGMAMAAILASALLFVTGRRGGALFVGQWPPTFIALALFYKLLRPSMESGRNGMVSATREMEEVLR